MTNIRHLPHPLWSKKHTSSNPCMLITDQHSYLWLRYVGTSLLTFKLMGHYFPRHLFTALFPAFCRKGFHPDLHCAFFLHSHCVLSFPESWTKTNRNFGFDVNTCMHTRVSICILIPANKRMCTYNCSILYQHIRWWPFVGGLIFSCWYIWGWQSPTKFSIFKCRNLNFLNKRSSPNVLVKNTAAVCAHSFISWY